MIWRLTLEEYGPEIEYIQVNKNIVTYTLSRFTINGNHQTTHESTYAKEIMSKINDTKKLPEDFPINLKLIYQYQRKDPSLMNKYKKCIYKTGSFRRGCNINLNLIMCGVNIFILLITQSYVLHWYHMYLINLGMDRT